MGELELISEQEINGREDVQVTLFHLNLSRVMDKAPALIGEENQTKVSKALNLIEEALKVLEKK